MAIPLRYATASQEIILGYFLDSTDGNTEETGLTIANTDIKLWKAGATTLANKNAGGATHISNGLYYATLDDTDTNTLGSLVIFIHATGALSVRLECVVLPVNVYDSLIAGTDTLQVDATTITSNADITAILADTNELQGLISSSKLPAQVKGMDSNVMTASALAADAVTEIVAGYKARTVDGTVTGEKLDKLILAMLPGKAMSLASNVYIFQDQAGNTVITITYAADSATAVIA